ncbi:menaquinone biosynthesis protein [Thermocrinis sp.]|uniref:menaquinone biosynthesis protein n=1 Tax=Thermocrinis sp. TaxID=2024383 RepID=UPI002FDD23A7
MFKVGKVSYLNTLPLFYKFEDPRVELVEGHPSELVNLLRIGKIQAGIVSSVEYLFHPHRYRIIPDVSISSKEKVCSVAILSKKPIQEIKKVHLTPASLTSKYLCFYILEEVYKLRPLYTKNRKEAEALLLIGDEALLAKKQGKYPYIYDLAQEWYKVHKLPFVFALFLVRSDTPNQLDEIIKNLVSISLKVFYTDLKEGKVDISGYSRKELEEYFTECLNNSFGERELLSMNIFKKFLESRGYAE